MKLLEIKLNTALELEPIDNIYWVLKSLYSVDFITTDGVWKLRNKPGWITDLRSGTNTINWISPKWGNPLYMAGVMCHDTAWSGWMSREESNRLLQQCCILSGECNRFQAWLVYQGVDKLGSYHHMDDVLPHPYTFSRKFESLRLYDE